MLPKLPPATARSGGNYYSSSMADHLHSMNSSTAALFSNHHKFAGMIADGGIISNNVSGPRPPVKRRLFATADADDIDYDDDDQENTTANRNPKPRGLREMVREIYATDRERGLRDWGFDFAAEMPCTSSSSSCNFEWSAIDAADVPKFYIRGYGSNAGTTTAANQPPNQRRRLNETTSEETAPVTITPNTSSSVEDQDRDVAKIIVVPKTSPRLDATPASNRNHQRGASGAKKMNANASSSMISRQARLTDFYSRRKRPASADDQSPSTTTADHHHSPIKKIAYRLSSIPSRGQTGDNVIVPESAVSSSSSSSSSTKNDDTTSTIFRA